MEKKEDIKWISSTLKCDDKFLCAYFTGLRGGWIVQTI